MRTLLVAIVACLATLIAVFDAHAQGVDAAPIEQEIQALAARQAGAARVEVSVGALDARLKLAACEKVQPHLPPGTRVWGTFRIGLRCVQGPVRWNVYLPVTVRVFGTALVAAAPLAAGAELSARDVKLAEVDLAASPSPTFTAPNALAGRTLARAIAPGEAIRADALRARQWFAAGETVTIVAAGSGFAVALEGQALAAGLEGQSARVRTESGRILTGVPVGERRLEVRL